MATIADLLGAKLPDNAGEDSFSLLPLLKGGDQPVRRHAVSASIDGVPAVRDDHWKYIAAPGSGGWGKGGDQSQPMQLYNLADDLGETKNLAAAMPEKVAEMQALLEKLITDGRSTSGAVQKNDVEVKRLPSSSTATPKKRWGAAGTEVLGRFLAQFIRSDRPVVGPCHGNTPAKIRRRNCSRRVCAFRGRRGSWPHPRVRR